MYHLPRGESPVEHIPHMNDIKPSQMPLLMNNYPRPSHIPPTRDHNNVPRFKLDMIHNLILDEIELHRIVDLDSRIGVTDGTTVVSDDVGYCFGTELMTTDFTEFEVRFLGTNSMDREATFNVVEETEVFAGTLDADHVWEKYQYEFE